MKCPHCEKEIPGVPCPRCGETVFETANYCMACGTPLKEDLQRVSQHEEVMDEDGEPDFEDRVLCPDGTCTGIIIDGKCTECGRIVGDDGEFVAQETGPVMEEKPSDDDADTEKVE
ncbi:MAG: zinc ribbon domain-containing protein [Deltaproteobacteria bacterium]|nr:zinc ribbon domain-containing protein [Deltaproteobacteria bacterium]